MYTIGLDFEKLKYPHNGLYTFCRQLGQRLLQHATAEERLHYYLPAAFDGFQGTYTPLPYKVYHRFGFRPPEMDLWHAVHQTGNIWPRKQARKAIVTIHDLNFMVDPRKSKWKKQRDINALQRQVDESDAIVSISQFTLDMIREYIQLGNKPCHIVYQGSEVKEFPGFDTPAYRPAKPFLFSIGMLLPKKNFHVLPALLQHNNYELIIAGKTQGDYIKKITEAAADMGVSHRVKLLGTISDEEKYWYYTHCNAFLFPSLAEGFGAPVVEAMHFGKPVFLSDKTSLPEVGGDAAYYFKSFDPGEMRQVFEAGMTHYQQENRAAAVRAHAQRFSWAENARAYMELYREVMKS